MCLVIALLLAWKPFLTWGGDSPLTPCEGHILTFSSSHSVPEGLGLQ